jgi:hypothetical protein
MRKFPRVSPKKSLTDGFVRALKASGRRTEVGDASCRGLSVRCTPAGVKTWTFAYKLNGRMRRITLGEYPALGLTDARTRADERRAQRHAGKDPRALQYAERAAQAQTTLKYTEKFAKFTPHDLRRTAATLAQSLRVPRDYVKLPMLTLRHLQRGQHLGFFPSSYSDEISELAAKFIFDLNEQFDVLVVSGDIATIGTKQKPEDINLIARRVVENERAICIRNIRD